MNDSLTEAGALCLGRSDLVTFYLLPSGDYRVLIGAGKNQIFMDGGSVDEVIELAKTHISEIKRAWKIAAEEARATLVTANRPECTEFLTIDYEIYDGDGNLLDQGHRAKLKHVLDVYRDKGNGNLDRD